MDEADVTEAVTIPEPPTALGSGARAESGLTLTEEGKLTQRAITWNPGSRWNTREPLAAAEDRQSSTLLEMAARTARELMAGSARAKGIGAKLVLAMEAANQRDEHEHRRQGDESRAINITTNNVLTVGQIKVVEHVDWYGSQAAAASAESAESDASSESSGDGE